MENERIYIDSFYDTDEYYQKRLWALEEQLYEAIIQDDEDKVILSIGSGFAREIFGLLKKKKIDNKLDIHLIEGDEETCALLEIRAKKYEIENLHVYHRGAASSNMYAFEKIPKADIIIFGEMFTWMSLEDALRVIRFFKQICKKNASVIWTKDLYSDFYGRPPTRRSEQEIRKYFKENEFSENYFLSEPEDRLSIGRYTYKGEEEDIIKGEVLFTYVERQRR